LVKSVGAEEVLDHKSSTVVQDIVALLQQREFVGVYDAISETPSYAAVKKIVDAVKCKVQVVVVSPCAADMASEWFHPQLVFGFQVLAPPHQGIGEYIFGEFLPGALDKGVIKAKPDAEVVGRGLESVQRGVDVLRKGVSAKKIVVEL
jgi:hypothetical protein